MSKINYSDFQYKVLKIPSDWSVLVCREKCFREAQILLLLKFRFGNRCNLSPDLLNESSQLLKVHPKTILRALKGLIKRDWIGFNSVNNLIYPRSFDTIRAFEGLKSRKAFFFSAEGIHRTREFIIASAISIYINRKEFSMRQRSQKGSGHFKWTRRFKLLIPAQVAVCNDAIAKYLDVSISTASKYKAIAVRSGLMKRERKYEFYCEKPKDFSKGSMEKARPDLKGRLRIRGKKMFLQRSDQMKSMLIPCRRRGQKTIYNNGHKKGKYLNEKD